MAFVNSFMYTMVPNTRTRVSVFLSIELSYFQQQRREQYRTKWGHYLYIPHNLYNLM